MASAPVRTQRQHPASPDQLSRRWNRVFDRLPPFSDAPSTSYYLECEQDLLDRYVGPLQGLRVLKLDLWNEAKNTRVLKWMIEQRAQAYGIDISPNVVSAALGIFNDGIRPSQLLVSDARSLPFHDAQFDLVYTMGTVEHFADTDSAIAEIHRVLRPGGHAVVGVPNKHDPFLRPLLVHVMNLLHAYPYGYERSYTAAELSRLMAAAGFEDVQLSGVLFMPGVLRMLDLFCFCYARPLSHLSGLMVHPFRWAYRASKSARRHGYLVAAIGRKAVP